MYLNTEQNKREVNKLLNDIGSTTLSGHVPARAGAAGKRHSKAQLEPRCVWHLNPRVASVDSYVAQLFLHRLLDEKDCLCLGDSFPLTEAWVMRHQMQYIEPLSPNSDRWSQCQLGWKDSITQLLWNVFNIKIVFLHFFILLSLVRNSWKP